jgi:predicted dehydrogenase
MSDSSVAPRQSRPFTRLGIIGTGEIVRMILPALRELENGRVTAVAGSSPSNALKLAGEFEGAAAYADYRALLESGAVDAVYIATPPHLHRTMMAAALAAGKHVVCEKPLVMSLDELRDFAALQEKYPALALASCSSRFHACPPVRAARELIQQGRLGRIQSVRLSNALDLPPPLAALPVWKRSPVTSGGGLLVDWGVYDLDWLRYLLGEDFDPVEVFGQVDYWGDEGAGLETGYAARILCRNGAAITLERRPEHGPRFQRAEVRGEAGGLDLPFMPGVGAPAALQWHRWENRTELKTQVASAPMCEWGPVLAYPVVDLIQAITSGQEVASPFSAQAKIHGVIEAVYRSSASGKSMAVPG